MPDLKFLKSPIDVPIGEPVEIEFEVKPLASGNFNVKFTLPQSSPQIFFLKNGNEVKTVFEEYGINNGECEWDYLKREMTVIIVQDENSNSYRILEGIAIDCDGIESMTRRLKIDLIKTSSHAS